jgi:hypothetical protein
MPSHITASLSILDIRRDKTDISLKEVVLDGLNPANGEAKTLPPLLLYDGTGDPFTLITTK